MLQKLRLALCALMITAVSCGEGDPPGGGNGNGDTDGGDDTVDGTTDNGGADGYVPNPSNPLIAVIPGMWEEYERDQHGGEGWVEIPPENRKPESVTIDPMDPDCSRGAPNPLGPPGDACIHWVETPAQNYLILEGELVRHDHEGVSFRGRVLDGGYRIEYEYRVTGGVTLSHRFRKLD